METVAVLMDTAIVQGQSTHWTLAYRKPDFRSMSFMAFSAYFLAYLSMSRWVRIRPQWAHGAGSMSSSGVPSGTVTVNCSPQPGQVSRRSSAIRFKNSSPLIRPERGSQVYKSPWKRLAHYKKPSSTSRTMTTAVTS